MPSSISPLRRLGRTWWPWALAAALLLVVGLAMRNDGERPSPPVPSAPVPAEPVPLPGGGAVPYPISAHLTGAFEQTQEGAVEAAMAYVTSGQTLLEMNLGEAELAVRAMAAATTVEAQVEDVRSRITALRRALAGGSGPLRYRQAVMATRIDQFSPLRARVAVWHVGVLSQAGVAPPQAGWAISAVDLVWESEDWRLEHETVSPGPAPILDASAAPATAEEFDAALAGFATGAGR